MLEKSDIVVLVANQLSQIKDMKLAARIRELLVEPKPVLRSWDYGLPEEKFICWTVIEHPASNTGIAYCEQGFGPIYPWGTRFSFR